MEHKQYTFQLDSHDFYHLEDFIISSSNSEAYKTLNDWLKNWGHLPFPSSLLLYGPISSGKTHLTKIWQSLSNAQVIVKNQIFNEEILNSNSAFIIEDIEDWEEELLLHYFNWINENKKYLLLTTARLINDFKLKDLKSRINSITRIEIKLPDDELLKIFLFKIFSNTSISASSQVQEYLVHRIPRQFNKIKKIVAQINEFTLTKKRNLTIPLIKEAMSEITR